MYCIGYYQYFILILWRTFNLKHCQKLTREQKKLLSKNNLDSYDYYMIKSVDNRGWLFQNKTDPDVLIICYTDQKGVFMSDGVTPFDLKSE